MGRSRSPLKPDLAVPRTAERDRTPEAGEAQPRASFLHVGRVFIHPWIDYLTIGGGLSLLSGAALWFASGRSSVDGYVASAMPFLFLGGNSAHFAASTVRLYTKPGAVRDLPFLTLVFPLVTFAVATLGIIFAGVIGKHLFSLYLTWSPFHYSMQAYGLSLMYCYRSGCALEAREKRWLWVACLMTFLKASLVQPHSGMGLWWILPGDLVAADGGLDHLLRFSDVVLSVLSILLPLAVFVHLARRGRVMPAISVLTILTNAFWFALFPLMNAIAWSTVFHALQYLVIVGVFHVKDQTALASNRHGPAWHAVTFYAWCVGLGYLLFRCWPAAYEAMGYAAAESALLVTAIINIHHFIVDGYIWKLRRDPNYRIVTGEAAAA